MRIYGRKEFLKLPAGTAYFKGKRWHFDGLTFKGDSLRNDWFETDPGWIDGKGSGECFDRLEEMLTDGASYPMQGVERRDGCYDDDDLFLVPERDDLLKLREWIDAAISVSDSGIGEKHDS